MTRTKQDTESDSGKAHGLPRPVVKKMRWPFPIIWLVPLAAAILTAFFLRDKIRERGTEITIQFNDGSGLKPGQTMHSETVFTFGVQ